MTSVLSATKGGAARPPVRRQVDALTSMPLVSRIALAADDETRPQRAGALMKRMAEVLRPVQASLESDTAALPPVAGNEKGVHLLRAALLALWDVALDWLEPQLEIHAARDDLNVSYTVLARIAVRPEFDASWLNFDASGVPRCDAITLNRYVRASASGIVALPVTIVHGRIGGIC
jgi:hypothetical protein